MEKKNSKSDYADNKPNNQNAQYHDCGYSNCSQCTCGDGRQSHHTGWKILTLASFVLVLISFFFASTIRQSSVDDTRKLINRISDLENRISKLEKTQAETNTSSDEDSSNSGSDDSASQTAKQKLADTLNDAKRRLSNASNNVKQTEGYRDLQAGVDVVASKLSQADTTLSENSQTYVKLRDMLTALIDGLAE